ncbi:bifunctional transcriptional activator/DNA repair enzyme AdaA [Pontibacter indicus]|uniref:Methylated-DNA--protein-cysteine methyltransferase n=1 Tax=Pontibacter indicus TaxID=1317125 RepID=A0A1R3XA87_9BACT|nr:methylated-DNA--[protein]-cysteine S-methyltransferase [Pontibacter indicus]SIT88098.1 AraC family transcriptional regulator, regulatory protein of adaptative response / methylated-DNA-[protein]-cysteine methyltransferase [Pontibacter indicus]
MLVTESYKIETYYKALVDRNQGFVGIFFVGVKTTSVFCIATCRARKPKATNVEFFTTFKDALDHGYRPCKICRPTENANQAPDQVNAAIELVRSNPKEKVSDYTLRQQRICPVLVRRWFKQHYGITFQAFQRMYRINQALLELKGGRSATDTAFDAGYESLSGFGYTYKKVMGSSPKQGKSKSVILLNRITTPLGPMFVCATEKGICLLEFVDRRMLETEFKDLQRLLGATIVAGENEHIKQASVEVAEYFAGSRKTFTLSLDSPGTVFQNLVWESLRQIPYGETRSYQQQAEAVGVPSAVRAVASANGFNRIALVIPCHRVIGKNGKLVGYGGGLERKQWLLEHEKQFAKQ